MRYRWGCLGASSPAALPSAPAHPAASAAGPSPHGCPPLGCTGPIAPAWMFRQGGSIENLFMSRLHLFHHDRAHTVYVVFSFTLRLMRGKPWPGAGGLAGRGPVGGLVLDLAGEGDAFLLNGFSLQVRYNER